MVESVVVKIMESDLKKLQKIFSMDEVRRSQGVGTYRVDMSSTFRYFNVEELKSILKLGYVVSYVDTKCMYLQKLKLRT